MLYGANYLANNNYNYQEILDYLTDKIVDEMYDTNKDIMLIALSDNEGIIIDDEKDFKLKIFGRDDQNE